MSYAGHLVSFLSSGPCSPFCDFSLAWSRYIDFVSVVCVFFVCFYAKSIHCSFIIHTFVTSTLDDRDSVIQWFFVSYIIYNTE